MYWTYLRKFHLSGKHFDLRSMHLFLWHPAQSRLTKCMTPLLCISKYSRSATVNATLESRSRRNHEEQPTRLFLILQAHFLPSVFSALCISTFSSSPGLCRLCQFEHILSADRRNGKGKVMRFSFLCFSVACSYVALGVASFHNVLSQVHPRVKRSACPARTQK